jgi:hypothetical protein
MIPAMCLLLQPRKEVPSQAKWQAETPSIHSSTRWMQTNLLVIVVKWSRSCNDLKLIRKFRHAAVTTLKDIPHKEYQPLRQLLFQFRRLYMQVSAPVKADFEFFNPRNRDGGNANQRTMEKLLASLEAARKDQKH